MLPYNTDMEPVRLPEYGRNIQGLIDYCISIPDKEERTACAYAIADTFASLYPSLIGDNQDYSNIWNQIQIMSNFKLDIVFPCEVISEEKMHPTPERLPYSGSDIRFRHYGRNIEKMIEEIAELEEGEEKHNLISMVANHMKKLMLQHNPEGVDDAKILRDLNVYSKGKINLDPENYALHQFTEFSEPHIINKRKKRK